MGGVCINLSQGREDITHFPEHAEKLSVGTATGLRQRSASTAFFKMIDFTPRCEESETNHEFLQ